MQYVEWEIITLKAKLATILRDVCSNKYNEYTIYTKFKKIDSLELNIYRLKQKLKEKNKCI